MSHASVIVAIEPTHKLWTAGVPEQAIAWEMEPFDENRTEMFGDGSRWDYWVIGGRYSGKFLGKNATLIMDMKPNKYVAYQKKNLREGYAEGIKKYENDAAMLSLCYGIKGGESEADYIKRELSDSWFPASYAFLRNRQWHETARMGWFGCTTATECERAGRADKPEWKCLFKHEETGAQIVTWNSDDETWRKKFYERFIKPLDPKTVLIVLDYHV